MEALNTQRKADIVPAAELSYSMITDFIRYIDRTEKTTKSYLTNLTQFAAWLSWAGISSPVRSDIIAYREWLSTEHVSIRYDAVTGWQTRTDANGDPIRVTCKPNTVVAYLRVVKQFFAWAEMTGVYPNVAMNIHTPRLDNSVHKKDAFSTEEVITIERSINESSNTECINTCKDAAGRKQRSEEQKKRLYALFLLAVNAGLRTIELSRANVRDLESKNGNTWLYVWGKWHSEPDQRKALAPEVANAVNDYLSCRADKVTGNSALFVATGNRSGGKRLDPTTISKLLKQAMRQAGYDSERLTAHSLRHTAGTAVMEMTGNLYTTQQYMRHTNPQTTEVYLHSTKQGITDTDTARRLYDMYHGKENDSRKRLAEILDMLNDDQIKKIASIAEDMLK